MKAIKIIQYVFSTLGAVALIVAILLTLNTFSFINKSKTVSGKIIDLVAVHSRGGFSYAPVVQFKTIDGQNITFKSSVASYPPLGEKGDTVEVLYDPISPNNASIKSFLIWFGPLLTGLFAVIFGGIGLGFIIGTKIHQNKTKSLQSSSGKI